MKLTKDTLIEGKIIPKGTEIKIKESPDARVEWFKRSIDENRDWILSQKIFGKKPFREDNYVASEELLKWVDKQMYSSNVYEGIEFINNYLGTDF